MAEKTSRLYSITPKELPLKSERGVKRTDGEYNSGWGRGWAVRGNIQRAQRLYELFCAAKANPGLNAEAYETEVRKQSERLKTLGIIADIAGESDLAMDLLERSLSGKTDQAYYLKYLNWRKSKASLEELTASLDTGELDSVIGIFLHKKEYETGDLLRSELRKRYRAEAASLDTRDSLAEHLYAKAANMSKRTGDWKGFLDDFNKLTEPFESFRLFDLIKIARIARKKDREVSDKIYELVEKNAKGIYANKYTAWAFIGMARAGKGDKKGAIEAYEKARCFTQVRNLRKNIGMSVNQIENKMFQREFYTHVSSLDRDFMIIEKGYVLNEVLLQLTEKAKKSKKEDLLIKLMENSGMYLCIDKAYELLGRKDRHPDAGLVKEVIRRIDEAEKIENPDYIAKAAQCAGIFADLIKDKSESVINSLGIESGHINHRSLLSSIGISKEAMDYLGLMWLKSMGNCRGEEKRFCQQTYGYRSTFFGKEGLESISSLFADKRYFLMLNGAPLLVREISVNGARELRKSSPEEYDVQEQIAKMLITSSKRLSRKFFSELVIGLREEPSIYYQIENMAERDSLKDSYILSDNRENNDSEDDDEMF